MGTYGPLAGGAFASDNVIGVVAWTAASNVQISDNSYATSVLLLGQISNYLKITNFGFGVPADATIAGVTVSVERSSNTLNGTHDDSIKLTVSGSTTGNDKATATQWPTSDAVASYGSATDLWGATWTPSLINDSTFGVEVASIADLASTAQIDYVSITVDYTGSNRGTNQNKYFKVGDGMSKSEVN